MTQIDFTDDWATENLNCHVRITFCKAFMQLHYGYRCVAVIQGRTKYLIPTFKYHKWRKFGVTLVWRIKGNCQTLHHHSVIFLLFTIMCDNFKHLSSQVVAYLTGCRTGAQYQWNMNRGWLWAWTWCSLDSCIAFSSLEPVGHAGKSPIGMNYTLNRQSC